MMLGTRAGNPLPTVRARLVSFVLACMLPIVAAAVAAILYVYQGERSGFERGLVEAGRALSLVVERELASREAVLQTLAASPSLTQRDLPSFYAYARQIAPGPDTSIALVGLDGQQLINTRQPLGAALPRTIFTRTGDPLRTLVSNLSLSPLTGQPSFAVQVPVVRDGQVIYYLSMGHAAGGLQRMLAAQRLPQGWIGSVLDGRGAVVARTHNGDKFTGQRPPDALLAALEAAQERVAVVTSLDGEPMIASLHRSQTYGWGFVIGVPQAQVNSPARAATVFAAIAALLIAASLVAARRLGRQLVEPIRDLATAAEAMGHGGVAELKATGLAETETVARALRDADASIRAASSQLEERVRQAVDEAEKAQQALTQNQRLEAVGQLTGGVAHDFNNLLMVVDTNVHLLRRQRPELAQDVQLGRIQRAVGTGTRLTRQLLAFSRRQPLRPQRLDLAQVLPELMDLVRPTLTARVRVLCEVEPGTACVLVDPAEFELAIINLAVNARDAMPDGGELRVSARNVHDDGVPGEAVRVEVADTGEGIPAHIIDKVFEPFFTTKEVGRGTGLGLSQVYGMATQAGGTVRVASEVDRGTVIAMLFPAAVADAGEEPADQPAPQRLARRVLLVEDNAELATAARELLLEAGCSVELAGSADEALVLLETMAPQPEVVLSDIRMPGEMDGVGLAARLQRTRPDLPVVLMTGYTPELEAARALRLQVLAKPVQPAELLRALAAAG
ncbi:MAG: hybrid sensor histidine kinase/response regulator [Comamonadaceae bacterium]|nr:MAG: hybrid sensor histidine kinase/response regulator [Comamonadaceae bacterium]